MAENKVIVVYQSRYGFAQQYARWIAEELGCDCVAAKEVSAGQLDRYAAIVYGGGIYAGSLEGVSLLTKNWEKLKGKKLFVFMVGLSDPAGNDYQTAAEQNFTPEQREHIQTFALRGGMSYRRMGFMHRTMMRIFVGMIKKKSPGEQSGEEKALLESYGQEADFSKREAVAPLVAAVRKAEKGLV